MSNSAMNYFKGGKTISDMPMSSTIQPRAVRCAASPGTWLRTASSTAWSEQSALTTKWCSEWCADRTRAGSTSGDGFNALALARE